MKSVNVEKRLTDKLVEECSEEHEMVHDATLTDNRNLHNSCTIYTLLLIITL